MKPTLSKPKPATTPFPTTGPPDKEQSKPWLNPEIKAKMIAEYKKGNSIAELCAKYGGAPPSTVHSWITKEGVERNTNAVVSKVIIMYRSPQPVTIYHFTIS